MPSGANLTQATMQLTLLRGALLDDETRIDARWRLVIQVLNNGAGGVNLVRANFNQASLANADLQRADLSNATMLGADLSGANLKSANLSNADLRHANLHGADVTARQLADAKSIAGATLPDGTKPG